MAEANVNKEDFQGKKDKPLPTGKSPLLAVLLIVNTLLMGFVAYVQWNSHSKKASEPNLKDIIKAEMKAQVAEADKEQVTDKVKEQDGILFPLEGFTANLAQTDGPRRYVRLNTVLKFKKNSSETEFKARQPQIRDVIISILNSKRPDDLLSADGKEFLKEEIKSAINTFLVDGSVIDVYYVSFQIN